MAMILAGLTLTGVGSYLAVTADQGGLASTVTCVPDLRGNCLPSLGVRRVEPQYGKFFGGMALGSGGIALIFTGIFGK
jgi:hypothetical protein